jgi:hypothetical protein
LSARSDLLVFDSTWKLQGHRSYIYNNNIGPIDFSENFYVPSQNKIYFALTAYTDYPEAGLRVYLQWLDLDNLPVDVIPEKAIVPYQFALRQNYPNPFNAVTTIEYSIASRSHVNISVFNILGQKVATLVNEMKTVGSYTVFWNGENNNSELAASGLYFYRIDAGKFSQCKKMILLK